MLTFKRWTEVLGYAVFFILFLVLALIFFDIVVKQTAVKKEVVKVDDKALANAVDMWKISQNGKKRYRLKAKSMIEKKDGVIILHDAQVWCFEDNKPDIYIKADRAVVYKNNNIDAFGHVFLKRKDLKIYGKSVYWIDNKKIAKSGDSFKGNTQKSLFSGKSFVYYQKKDELTVKGVDIWLR